MQEIHANHVHERSNPARPGLLTASACLLLVAVGCSAGPPVHGDADDDSATRQYCYRQQDERLTENIRLTVSGRQVSGQVQGTIHDETAGYFTGYVQRVAGTLSGDTAEMRLTTWIEYDVQQSQETWQIFETKLVTASSVLPAADCAQVSRVFQDEAGLEASDLEAGAAATHEKRVRFAPGAPVFTAEGGVIRGERDVYILTGAGGQAVSVEITAVGDNAVFDMVTPSGLILAHEATSEDFLLPETGDYRVIVGGTWGNTSYELTVTLQ